MHAHPDDESLFMAELAATLSDWPVRNQVVRRALDHARDELLRLAQNAQWRAERDRNAAQ